MRTRETIAEDMHRLEVGTRQLKVLYDQFFAGALKVEPYELRHQLERLIKSYAKKPIQRYADRFRFNALVSRFNSFSELWGKRVRSFEEGDRRPAATSQSDGIRERLVTRCVVSDQSKDDPELKRLHRRYLEAVRRDNPDKKGVPFERFARGVAAQTRNLRDKHGCDQIELRVVVKDDRVELKARPGR